MVLKIFLIFAVAANFWSVHGKNLPAKEALPCVQEPRDIFLLVDGSASVGITGFSKVQDFILALIREVDVREDMTHFGLLQFSSKRKTKIEFTLDESHDSNVLLRKVKNLKYQSGIATRTGRALGIVEKEVFTVAGDDRPHVKDYVVLFTDGQATDKYLAFRNAKKLKDRGVRIIAIGAGPRREDFLDQLEAIASSPSDVFIADFDNLEGLAKDIVNEIVNEVCAEPPLDPSKMICSQEPRDVFLVVDGSLSIGERDFEKIRQFLTKLVKSVVVNPNMTHFGLLQFSSLDKTRIEFSLDYSHREATLLNRIKFLRYQAGDSTRTGNALKIVDEQIYTVEGDDRPHVEDILIVFTDGATRDQPKARKHAKNMKDRGVHIMAIAAGSKRHKFKHQLEEIASNKSDVFMVEFDKLDDIIYGLVNKVCKAPPTTVPPTTTPAPTTTEPTTTPAPTTTPEPTTTLPPTTTPRPTTLPSTTPPPVCSRTLRRDILIMVDGPVTMRPRQFNRVKSFLFRLIPFMSVENGNFMVGIMQLGDAMPHMSLEFSPETTKSEIKDAIIRMGQYGSNRKFNSAAFGSAGYELHKINYLYSRSDAEDVIILITTRETDDVQFAEKEMRLFQYRGIKVITLVAGKKRRRVSMHLQELAGFSKPPIVSIFRKLGRYAKNVMQEVCPAFAGIPATQPPAPPCSRAPHDIFFVVDGSASIKAPNFVFVRKFLMDLLDLLRVGISDINVGLLQFSEVEKTEILLELGKYNMREQLELVHTMQYQSGKRTMTGDALTRVKELVFNGHGGDRPEVQNVVILFTDGNAHDKRVAIEQAGLMKDDGVRVIAIGAGVKGQIRQFDDELKAIASDPVEDNFLTVYFEDLSGFANEAFPLICRDTKHRQL